MSAGRTRVPNRRRSAAALFVAVIALVALVAIFSPHGAHAAGSGYQGSGDVVQFGSDIDIPKDQIVNGDVVAFGGDINVHGHVRGSAVTFGGTLHIYPEGAVDRDTVAFGGDIINESRSTPPKHVTAPPTAETQTPMPETTPETVPEQRPSTWWGEHESAGVWASIVVPDFLLTLLMFFLFPARVRNVEDHLVSQPFAATVLGFVSPLLLVFVIFILLVLVVTFPLIPVAIIAALVGYWIGKAALALFLGRRLLEAAKVQDPRPLASVVVGLFLMLIITGPTPLWFAIMMFSVIGAVAMGAALLSFARRGPGGPLPAAAAAGTMPLGTPPGFTPPAGPAASGPPAIPQ